MRRTMYHVVCRDCPSESLRRTEEAATGVAADHAETTDHDVAVGHLGGADYRVTTDRVR